jgi:hypothetical protein
MNGATDELAGLQDISQNKLLGPSYQTANRNMTALEEHQYGHGLQTKQSKEPDHQVLMHLVTD